MEVIWHLYVFFNWDVTLCVLFRSPTIACYAFWKAMELMVTHLTRWQHIDKFYKIWSWKQETIQLLFLFRQKVVPPLPFFTELVYATSTAVLFQVRKKIKKNWNKFANKREWSFYWTKIKKNSNKFSNKREWQCYWRWQHWNHTVWALHIGTSSKGSQAVRWVRWAALEINSRFLISFQKVN